MIQPSIRCIYMAVPQLKHIFPVYSSVYTAAWYLSVLTRSIQLPAFSAIIQSSQVAQVVKNLPANSGKAGEVGSIPELGRCPGKGNDNSLQYSFFFVTLNFLFCIGV